MISSLVGLINTYISLCASCMSAFAISALVNSERKFCMVSHRDEEPVIKIK